MVIKCFCFYILIIYKGISLLFGFLLKYQDIKNNCEYYNDEGWYDNDVDEIVRYVFVFFVCVGVRWVEVVCYF